LAVSQPESLPVATVETVVKLGGGVLARLEHFDAALGAIGAAASVRSLLIVPGGGPFADTVRDVDQRLGLSDEAAHWMAVLAMDQYAHLIAAKLPRAVVVEDPREIATVLGTRRIPVLAPSRWLRETDPLPHSWDVTSDSIAAWIAGRLGARRLVLVKPPCSSGESLTDAYFTRALPAHVSPAVVPADDIDALREALAQ
jgi:5-(aminomethyl)-3-furanmethanol phosphate kinase